MEKPKYLVVSITEPHEELLEVIKAKAREKKVSVSHYVRSLLYDAMYEKRETTALLDGRRAKGAVV